MYPDKKMAVYKHLVKVPNEGGIHTQNECDQTSHWHNKELVSFLLTSYFN